MGASGMVVHFMATNRRATRIGGQRSFPEIDGEIGGMIKT